MPSVNLSQETYEKLKKLAAAAKSDPDSAAEDLLRLQLAARGLSREEWAAEFRRVRDEIRAGLDPSVSEGEIQADIDEAIREVSGAACERSLTPTSGSPPS